jgi:ABC-type nitrate/sulfonate/bicarbonate transport system substrate-binding protein
VVSGEELTKVRIATLPYFDYTGFVAAHELGLDREVGLEFEFVPFPLEGSAVQALMRGSIDVAQGAIGSFIPLVPQALDLRVFLNNVQFKGFVFIGREGKIKTYEELLEENNDDFEAAQRQTIEQFKGKTFLLVKSSFESMLRGALEQVGLTLDDVTILDFQNDAQAAVAFMRGIGDLYTGSLPQQMRLLSEPEYVAVAGNEVLGAAGLWYSNSAVTERYLNENRETVLKVVAVYYRFLRYLYEMPDETLQHMIGYLNQHAATNMTIEEAIVLRDEYEDFATIEDSLLGVYDPDSPLYWEISAEYLVNQNAQLGKVPASMGWDWVVKEELFYELLEDDELLSWVQSPIK